MKNLMGVMEGGSIPALNNLEESLKNEQKVPYFPFNFCSEIYMHANELCLCFLVFPIAINFAWEMLVYQCFMVWILLSGSSRDCKTETTN